MRTHDGYDAQDSYERAEDAMGENARNRNDDIESNGKRFQETPPDVAATMRSLIKSQEDQHQLNAAMLQSLTDLQRKIDSDEVQQDQKVVRAVLGEGEGILVGHLILKNPVGIQVLLPIKEKERDTIGIALEMNLRKKNLLCLMVR